MMRRFVIGLVVLSLLMAPMPFSNSAPQTVAAQEVSSASTTDNLNLRNQASLSGAVLRVIPRGSTVTVRGAAQNGFLPVTWQGTQGWAHSDYLAVAPPSGSPAQTGTVTESLNFRIGPSTGQRVILVIPAGANVTITGTSSNGFLAITYGGYTGYAHGDWIRTTTGTPPPVETPPPTAVPEVPSPTGTGRVTEGLNMRSQPNTSSAVIMVMPAGATVTLTGSATGDFLQVQYSNRTGWSHRNWIQITTPAEPTPPEEPEPVPDPAPPVTIVQGTGRVTENLNMRSQATTASAIILTMPAGATVTLTGEVSGLFYQVVYNGRTGWAHKDWIRLNESTVTPTNMAQVTESVNLRGGPATSYKRIMLLPAGAMVTLTGQQSNGFHSVSFNGRTGWAFSTYLNLDQGAQNLPVIPPGSVESEPELYAPIATNQGFHYTNAIVGPTRGTPEQAIEYAQRTGAMRMADVELLIREFYRLGPILGFDPALLVAQSALETGNWRSGWWVDRLNPAGLGINDDPSTHPYSDSFPNGTIAARAQMAHMHAEVYGSRVALHPDLQGTDVTYQAVFQAGWAGTIVTLEDLSGTWATDPQYGWKISRVASYIFG